MAGAPSPQLTADCLRLDGGYLVWEALCYSFRRDAKAERGTEPEREVPPTPFLQGVLYSTGRPSPRAQVLRLRSLRCALGTMIKQRSRNPSWEEKMREGVRRRWWY